MSKSVRKLYNEIVALERLDPDHTPGSYPIDFYNDWFKMKYILYSRWRNFLSKVKKLCHL